MFLSYPRKKSIQIPVKNNFMYENCQFLVGVLFVFLIITLAFTVSLVFRIIQIPDRTGSQ